MQKKARVVFECKRAFITGLCFVEMFIRAKPHVLVNFASLSSVLLFQGMDIKLRQFDLHLLLASLRY